MTRSVKPAPHRPVFHIENVFDIFTPHRVGVNGRLKLKCLQTESRVVGMAGSGDIVAVSAGCPQAFIDYTLRVKTAEDVVVLRHHPSPDLAEFLGARSVLSDLTKDPHWPAALGRRPLFSPYMPSASIIETARECGLDIPPATWEAVVVRRLAEQMNDKAVFHGQCSSLGLPVPRHCTVSGAGLVPAVIDLMKTGPARLYVRQARSGGAYGNVTVEKTSSGYRIQELAAHRLDARQFSGLLDRFARTSHSERFVIAEHLHLHASPGTLFYATDDDVDILCHSDQVLGNDKRFLGFTYPIADEKITRHFPEAERSVRTLIDPWRRRGFRGYGNVDWMVTTDGSFYLAELNARQTGVVPPVCIENAFRRRTADGAAGGHAGPTSSCGPRIDPPELSLMTADRICFDRPITFAEVHRRFAQARLLWRQGAETTGVVVTFPPIPRYGVNSVGFMALAPELPDARRIYTRALQALGARPPEFLYEPAA